MERAIKSKNFFVSLLRVTQPNIPMKEFRAGGLITKVIVADFVSNITSAPVAKFLHKVIDEMPFKVKSIQVSKGSEFMVDLEEECENLKLPLYVLPPSRP